MRISVSGNSVSVGNEVHDEIRRINSGKDDYHHHHHHHKIASGDSLYCREISKTISKLCFNLWHCLETPSLYGIRIIIIIIIIITTTTTTTTTIIIIIIIIKSHDSCVGIGLDYGLDGRGYRVRFLAGAGNFSLHHHFQNGSGAHPASYPMGYQGLFP
jgi:hypothetical protein